jgi:hypothetical protein
MQSQVIERQKDEANDQNIPDYTSQNSNTQNSATKEAIVRLFRNRTLLYIMN